MAKKKVENKSEERIKDKPTKAEVKRLLARAKKVAEKKEKEDKLDKVLQEIGGIKSILSKYTKKTDRIETLLSEKDTKEQKAQTKLSSEEELAKIQAEQDKEKAQGKQGQPGQQPGRTQRQPTPEEVALGATLQFGQDVNTAQAAQTQAQEQGQQRQPGQVLTPQGAWLVERGVDAAKVILPAFFQSKGSNTGVPLKEFFDQLKIYQSIENTIMGGFFNFMKNLSPQLRQTTMDNIATSAPTPTITNLPPKSETIK